MSNKAKKLKNFMRMKINDRVGKLTTVSSKTCRVPSLRCLHKLTKRGSRTSLPKKMNVNPPNRLYRNHSREVHL